MKAIKFIAAICLLFLFTAKVSAQEVVELKMPESNKVVIKLNFNVGSTADPAGKEGLTALTANLVKEGGTATMTKAQIDDVLYPIAAGYGVSVDKEATTFTFQVPADHVNTIYPILKGLILTPTFNESDFNRVKAQQLNYVTRSVRNSNDEDYSKLVFEDFLYRGTNYQHMVSGNQTGVNNITLEDVKKHYNTYFTEDNLIIGLAGNYTDDFKDQIEDDMEALPELTVELPVVEDPKMPKGVEVEIISKPGAFGSAVYMGYPIDIERDDEDWAALMIANSFLGEHRKSYGRLYEAIRETRSMNYGDYSYIEWYPSGSNNMLPVSGYPRSTNAFALWIRPVQLGAGLKEQYSELANIKQGHAHFAIRMALYQVNRLIEEGMTQEEVELTKSFLRSYVKLYVKDLNQRLGYLIDSRYDDMEDYISGLDERLENVTVEDVNEAIKKYMQVKNLKVAVITSPEEAKVLAENLKKNQPSPMSYANMLKNSLDPSVFEVDKKVERFPLNVTKVTIVPTENTFKK